MVRLNFGVICKACYNGLCATFIAFRKQIGSFFDWNLYFHSLFAYFDSNGICPASLEIDSIQAEFKKKKLIVMTLKKLVCVRVSKAQHKIMNRTNYRFNVSLATI